MFCETQLSNLHHNDWSAFLALPACSSAGGYGSGRNSYAGSGFDPLSGSARSSYAGELRYACMRRRDCFVLLLC
jgi:hypothetical protein